MKRVKWTDDMVATVCDLFPVESTERIANMLDISIWSVKNKASELGLQKFKKTKYLERALFIKNNFDNNTFSEMSKALGITVSSVRRIASDIGLKRSVADRNSRISSSRRKLISRERRRIVFGLEQTSHLKVVTNRPRITLRCKMKSHGYVVSEDNNLIYYPAYIHRNEVMEQNGVKLGLRFMPLPIDEQILSTNVI